ncbi:MAG: hypothetical protein GY842_23765 [bacterium]|nr:hypothetical protein [bacterium]
MEAWTRLTERKLTEGTRQRSPARPLLLVTAEGMGELDTPSDDPPSAIHLETTHPDGEVVEWFDDYWWMDVIKRWEKHPVAIHILPTPGALLHPVVLHHLEMLFRVAQRWRRVGHCYVSDVISDEDVQRLAMSTYEEVRVIDAFRPGTLRSGAETREVKVEKLIGQLMRVRSPFSGSRPVLIRVPAEVQPAIDTTAAERPELVAAR